MVIRPLVAAGFLGEIGRPAGNRGSLGGSAAFYNISGGSGDSGKDSVTLGGARAGANLYAPSPLFKMTGAVELTSDD